MHFNEKGLLTSIDGDSIAKSAFRVIKEEQTTTTGLICRWEKLNLAVLKNWRFKTLYTIAGSSGSGKSYILNMLRSDFTDTQQIILKTKGLSTKYIEQLITYGEFIRVGDDLVRNPINGDFNKKILWLNFGFDMAAEIELLRSAAIITGTSYAHLLSSSLLTGRDEAPIYNKITEEEAYVVQRVMRQYSDHRPNVVYFREPGTIQDILIVIDKYANRYPDHQLAISIDHLLLLEKGSLKSDLELQNDAIKKLKDARDIYNAMIIDLTQFNSEIEEDRRRLNHVLHYPMKSDIYCGGQVFQSSDFVFTAFMPESINLTSYGPRKVPTSKLIHFGMIKSRHGKTGNTWLLNHLERGQIYGTSLPYSPTSEKMILVPQKTLINQV